MEKTEIRIPLIILEWCNWQPWERLESGEIEVEEKKGVYEVRIKGEEDRLTIGKSNDLKERIIKGLIKGKKKHSTGNRIRDKDKEAEKEVRWARTDYPAAVEEYLLIQYMKNHNGDLPKRAKHMRARLE